VTPALITEAPVNADDELHIRRRRYLAMMTLRLVCIVGAASTIHVSGWLAAGFVVAALVLPWAAVLIANDRLPKQQLRFRRFIPGRSATPELPAVASRSASAVGDPSADTSGRVRPTEDSASPHIIDL
jgi:hypothetical protein